jgi:hypothetical protein
MGASFLGFAVPQPGAVGCAVWLVGVTDFPSKFLALHRSADLYAKRRMGFARAMGWMVPIGTASPASHLPWQSAINHSRRAAAFPD